MNISCLHLAAVVLYGSIFAFGQGATTPTSPLLPAGDVAACNTEGPPIADTLAYINNAFDKAEPAKPFLRQGPVFYVVSVTGTEIVINAAMSSEDRNSSQEWTERFSVNVVECAAGTDTYGTYGTTPVITISCKDTSSV